MRVFLALPKGTVVSLAITNALGPVFLIMTLGWALRQAGFMTRETLQDINRLVYWVGFPSLLFYKIAGAKLAFGEADALLIVTLGATCTTIMAGYLFARWLSVPWTWQ